MAEIELFGKQYPVATTLRVAFKVQGYYNHKPYMDIFENIDKMPVEEQINIIYAAFTIANPQEVKDISSRTFLDYYLDNYTVLDIMEQLKPIISGILGKDLDSVKSETPADSNDSGNLVPLV